MRTVTGPALYSFLDISTAMIPKPEMDAIEKAPTTVMRFEHGAWVNVSPEDDDDAEWAAFPNLRAVLAYARTVGARYVLLDGDGVDVIPGLPRFTW